MARPISSFGSTYMDYSREKSTFRLFLPNLTAANFVAELAAAAALQDAILATTLGREVKRTVQAFEAFPSSIPPTTKLAQRENKWLARYHDALGRSFQCEIPCADLSQLATNSDFYDTSLGTWTTLLSAWSVAVVSPDDVSSTVLDSFEFVGRRG